ncbi:MAG: DUF4149 domain-containing protein [Pseudorhodoplanes sp.]
MATPPIVEKRRTVAAILIVAAIWFGMLIGVSFLATPAKFLATSLTMPVALDIGHHTFAIFNKVEWLLAIVLLLTVLAGHRTWLGMGLALLAILLVAAETFWLLPLLDQRVAVIIAGQQPPPSELHNLYVACETAKSLVLILVIVIAARRLAASADAYAAGSSAR